MKSNNCSANLQIVPSNSEKHQRQTSINRGAKCACLFGALLALALFTFTATPAQAADLFNNFNTAGVLSGPPQPFTVFTLSQPAQITELETYHWFNGRGTPTSVGNIGIWSVSSGAPGQMIRAFAAHGVAASFGVIADWVADTNCAPPGCFLPAGTYAIEDSSPSTWSYNSGSGLHGFAVVRGNFVSAIPAGAIVLTGLSTPPPSTGTVTGQSILFTNMNTQGVATGVAPNLGTLFTLKTQASPVQYEISQLATYHFNGGAGAPPGVISIWTTSRKLLFAGNAQGVRGQGGGIDNWVVNVNPPLKLLPGTYILDDSSHNTWSHNSGSAGCLPFNRGFECGMGTVFGTMVALQLQPPPVYIPPQPSGFPYTCHRNSGAVANILSPCTGRPRAGQILPVQTTRALPAFTAILFSFHSCPFCGLPAAPLTILAIPAAFTGGGVAAGSTYMVTVPPGVCGGPAGNTFTSSVWDVVPIIGGTPQGAIGQYEPNCN